VPDFTTASQPDAAFGSCYKKFVIGAGRHWQSEIRDYHKFINAWHCDTTPHAAFLLIAPDQAK
jgi:hypothetical protein